MPPRDLPKQTTALLTYTEYRVTNPIDSADSYRIPLPCETVAFELTEYSPTGSGGRYQASDFVEDDPGTAGRLRHRFTNPDVAYEETATGPRRRRPIEWLRTLYRRDDLTALLPLGQLQPLALTGESYKLAFTPGLLTQTFQRGGQALLSNPQQVLRVAPASSAADRGGYVDLDGDGRWWIPSGLTYLSPASDDTAAQELAFARVHFFLPHRFRDPFHTNGAYTDSIVTFDANNLLIAETRDAIGNRTTIEENDYRVLQPRLVSDPNRNQSAVAFDALGMVVGTAVMGKPLPAAAEGDSLAGFVADLDETQIDAIFAQPRRANGTATEATPLVHTLLAGATTRTIYDLRRFMRLGEPAFAGTIARETHVSDLPAGERSRLLVSFSYSDGFGREVQKKVQAEAGRLDVSDTQAPIVNPRWVGSGWIIFNNKGKPVRQYEPFFSITHWFEFGVIAGVSPVLFYDPAERVIATLHPNHTYEKVVFDPWQQTTYDVNDTCAARNAQTGDPRTDPDIRGYVGGYFGGLPASPPAPAWRTWRAQRSNSVLGAFEEASANRAAGHADTPTTIHFDTLGRRFLTVGRNRVSCPGHDLDGVEDSLLTRVELDIEGNERAVIDERLPPVNGLPTGTIEQRIVMTIAFDMLGNRIHQVSMDAGARWMLNDVTGKPIRAWDSRGHRFTTAYDVIRRPVRETVRGTIATGGAASDDRTLNSDVVVERIEYGEPPANAAQAVLDRAVRCNLRTRIYRQFDSAGVEISARLDASDNPTEAYDFKGNLLRTTRRFATAYQALPDWSLNPPPALENERFEAGTRYDALNRPIQVVAPHSDVVRAGRPNPINVIQPVYNDANLLERVDVWLERPSEPLAVLDPAALTPSAVGVAGIEHDALGRRLAIQYKNGATTEYEYDRLTRRLVRLRTRRAAAFAGDDPQPPDPLWPGRYVQNLRYTFDPAGNITHVEDQAQQTIYFANRRIDPSNDFTYDALYRLVEARGREHLGQAVAPVSSYNDAGRTGVRSAIPAGRFGPNDGGAMGNYTERYVYDAVGNFLQVQHERSDLAGPGWTRLYAYGDASVIEPARRSNRLSGSSVGTFQETYQHDAHGNMTGMPQLQQMQWDFKDQLRLTRRQRVNDDDAEGIAHEGERTYYVYDASGQRARKVTVLGTNGVTDERIYLGGFEIYRDHGGATGPIDATTATLERETLHVMDDKQRIALVETRTEGSDAGLAQLIRYQLGNHLGSASLELDDAAEIISYEEYAPYGSTTYQAVRSQTETSKRYRYIAKERDEESGLCYHGARYYAPWLGRWTRYDPLYLKDATNVYVYALNNPIIATDPTGGPVWLIPVVIYLGWRALESAAETGVEAGIAKATDDKDFSVGGTFVKNMAVNTVVGLIPGAVEAKLTTKAAIYGAKLAVRTAGDATYETLRGRERSRRTW